MSTETITSTERSSCLSSGKIKARHMDKLAIVYVRQSTLQQVSRHQESTRLQYGLVDRVVQLGWPPQRVEVIDDDLGCSGATMEGRPGFQRLVAEVGLDHVGIVLGIEMSRLARSCKDWHQLLEVCAVFGTLIGDLDGIYDPALYNDRLLLGLKGTMSEAELHVIKQRMLQGKEAKARRGELGMLLPMGYVCHPSGEVIKDPDEEAQAVIALVFDQFERRGTINGVLQYLVRNGVRLPCRIKHGGRKGDLDWRRPSRATLSNMFHHPIYAGAYSYGRRPTDPRRKKPGRPSTGRTVATLEDWAVLLKDKLPAYISWEQYERNRAQLAANRASAAGVVRKGPSLLSGLLICGHCGLRMATQYSSNGRGLRYTCSRMASDYGEPMCQSLAGGPLDKLVAEMILRALEPAALDVSLKVAGDIEAERARLREQWDRRLERARYESERARRQYNMVEPENRLVARTLERKWEEALAAEEAVKKEAARFFAQQPPSLSVEERESIRRLASDIPSLWNASTTSAADRQAIVRQLVDRVLVTVQGETEKVEVQIHWAGGYRTQTTVTRPVARLDQLSYYRNLLDHVAKLHAEGLTATAISRKLNDEGWRPPKRRETFTREMVSELLSRQGLRRRLKKHDRLSRRQASSEWTIRDLAQELSMPKVTLYFWLRRGLLDAHCVEEHPRKTWIIRADEKEINRLKSLRKQPGSWSLHVRVNEAN
jgi:DNA invertase Pin-like site-specific DNA recombinase